MSENQYLRNVILFTRGTKGDLYPFLSLGTSLQENGCDVTLLSNYCYEDYARNENFSFQALDDQELFERLNNMPEFHMSFAAKFKLSKDHIIAHIEKEVEIIQSKILPNSTVIVAHSNDYLAPLLVAEKFNIRLYLCMLAPSYAHGFSFFEAMLKSLPEELNDIRHKMGLTPIQDWKLWLSRFTECFAFWPEWFSSEIKENIPSIKFTGFMEAKDVERRSLQENIISFIEENRKTVVVTHGTSKPFNENYFRLAINACQKIGCKLIVSTPFRSLLPEDLSNDILWVEYCSFNELLPLVDLIVHHGGIGTTCESIAHEIPQLIIGQGFDRQHNGKIIMTLNLGDRIVPKELTEDFLQSKVNSLLNNTKIKDRCSNLKSRLYSQAALNSVVKIITGTETTLTVLEEKKFDAPKAISIQATDYASISVEDKLSAMNVISPSNSEINKPNRKDLLIKMLKNKSLKLEA